MVDFSVGSAFPSLPSSVTVLAAVLPHGCKMVVAAPGMQGAVATSKLFMCQIRNWPPFPFYTMRI